MGRFVPITYTTQQIEKASVPKYTAACLGGAYGAKSYYDGKQCWQYKIVMDRPGNYCWQVPNSAICVRTVLVGGGGKPKCISVACDGSGSCNSVAGAGGSYSEKCHAVTGGSTYFCVVVGRQEATTSVSCNGSAVHSAAGASGAVPGVATGGDWNSRGGCAGYTCNNCGGSYSHYCGSCKYFCYGTCCGYCVVWFGTDASTQTSCCNILVSGGGSAGSPVNICGGSSSCLCGYYTGPVAGGGAGIGSGTCRSGSAWHYSCCCCICLQGCANYEGFYMNYNGLPSSEGGGGSKYHQSTGERCRSWDADCIGGRWRGGNGGPGGPEGTAIHGWQFEWGAELHCAYPYGTVWSPRAWECFQTPCQPIKQNWWDITDICGSGSPGIVASNTANNCCGNCGGWAFGPRPQNSGEGAGTGGWAWTCCDPTQNGSMLTNAGGGGGNGPLVNWPIICQLGICGWCDQSWLMQDALYPFFVTCAGTLGGSGGVGICGYMSKAGAGGGGGQAKCGIICVCYGGSYDLCNGSGPALAFPPSLLDMQMSNAGVGLAIIYWREA